MTQHACALMQQDMVAMSAGELDTSIIKRIAKTGSQGEHSGNISRDFLRAISQGSGLRSETIDVPLQDKLSSWTENMLLLLPHEVFATLYHSHRSYFMKYVMPSVSEVVKFWRQVKGWAST